MLTYIPYVCVMALMTYLIRSLPLLLFRKEITNIYIKSFLQYVPYAVLSAMTFPAIFFVSDSMIASFIATIVALYLAYKDKSLLSVALWACMILWLCDYIL